MLPSVNAQLTLSQFIESYLGRLELAKERIHSVTASVGPQLTTDLIAILDELFQQSVVDLSSIEDEKLKNAVIKSVAVKKEGDDETLDMLVPIRNNSKRPSIDGVVGVKRELVEGMKVVTEQSPVLIASFSTDDSNLSTATTSTFQSGYFAASRFSRTNSTDSSSSLSSSSSSSSTLQRSTSSSDTLGPVTLRKFQTAFRGSNNITPQGRWLCGSVGGGRGRGRGRGRGASTARYSETPQQRENRLRKTREWRARKAAEDPEGWKFKQREYQRQYAARKRALAKAEAEAAAKVAAEAAEDEENLAES